MSTDSVDKFLAKTGGNLNRDKTVLWGHLPDDTDCEVQFLNSGTSLEEYFRRAGKANDTAPKRKREDLLPAPVKIPLGIGAFAPLLGAIAAPAYLSPSRMPLWLPILGGIALVSLAVIGVLRLIGYFRRRSNASIREELGEELDRIRSEYCEPFDFEIDLDDARERHGVSPLRAAMDRITPDARDSLAALVRAGDDAAAESILRALIREERTRLDQTDDMAADRVAKITEDVLKQTR